MIHRDYCNSTMLNEQPQAGKSNELRRLAVGRIWEGEIVAVIDFATRWQQIDWSGDIAAEIDAMPDTIADVTDAYNAGWFAAENDEECNPTLHYAKLPDIEQFVLGWRDGNKALAETLELEDDMQDRMYWSRGEW